MPTYVQAPNDDGNRGKKLVAAAAGGGHNVCNMRRKERGKGEHWAVSGGEQQQRHLPGNVACSRSRAEH